jgi:hypothetical protein
VVSPNAFRCSRTGHPATGTLEVVSVGLLQSVFSLYGEAAIIQNGQGALVSDRDLKASFFLSFC